MHCQHPRSACQLIARVGFCIVQLRTDRLTAGQPCRNPRAPVSMAKGAFSMRPDFRRSTLSRRALLAALALTVSGASPARADRCEDIAKQLKARSTASRSASRPARSSICRTRRPRNFRSAAAARTTPTSSTPRRTAASRSRNSSTGRQRRRHRLYHAEGRQQTGSTRCIKRMGLLRGDNVKMRFRRLNMECTRTKTEAAIAITRGKDE